MTNSDLWENVQKGFNIFSFDITIHNNILLINISIKSHFSYKVKKGSYFLRAMRIANVNPDCSEEEEEIAPHLSHNKTISFFLYGNLRRPRSVSRGPAQNNANIRSSSTDCAFFFPSKKSPSWFCRKKTLIIWGDGGGRLTRA